MKIPLFENVIMSIMVEHLFAFVASSALMPIFVTFGYTFVDGCTLTSDTSSSSVSFCVAYASIDRCSTPLSTTTTGGYFAIQISLQITKKDVSEIPLLRTIIPRKLLSFCNTITFAPVQSQVLCNSRTWYNHKTFPITIAFIHCLRLTLHRKLFAANPSPQQLSEPTQKSIGFRYKI
jgi:hypothetical protein